MFDCNSFLQRMGWGQKDLAERLHLSTSTVGMWCIGKTAPSYSVIVELVKLGMNLEELFGPELAEMFKSGPDVDDVEFEKRVKRAILNMLR